MQLSCGIQQWIQNQRTLLQVELEDTITADETFQQLMGDDVEPRRKFIEANAQYVKNIDT